MEAQSRCFSYEKSIVINALYDTIDALGLCLESSNSLDGTLIISDAQQPGRMQINLSPAGSEARTQVSILPEEADRSAFDTWSIVLLDELSGTIERARRPGRGNLP